jgi:carboxypeptidase Taq
MKRSHKDYEELHALGREARLWKGISELLEWDQETYMPPESGELRAEQHKLVAGLLHRERTGSKFSEALNKLIDIKSGEIKAQDLSSAQQAALSKWRRDYIRETSLPVSFVEEFALLTSEAQLVWRKAKQANDFKLFEPYLEKVVHLCRKKADLLGYREHPYDALLDLYEPGMSTREVNDVFSLLQPAITSLVKQIAIAEDIDDAFLFGAFDHEQQIAFGKLLLDGLGYIPSRCRLDISTHPFSTSFNPFDHRITTRIHTQSLMSNISAIMHEAGHALYEMGLPAEHYGSPLGEAISLGMHESQSRWWETRIGQSYSFWQHYYPYLQLHFKSQLAGVSLETFYRAINKVKPSFIRVEADEVTYPLHVILRFDIEKALIEGKLAVKDLPEYWNAKMHVLLGIEPKTNSEGCLQDIHWSSGAFGYFPTYALGNLYAAQFFKTFANEHPDWETRVAAGDLLFVRNWLHRSVHMHGRQYDSRELLKKITNSSFSAEAYIAYLSAKYKGIYNFESAH